MARKIAIDIGQANVRIYEKEKGLVIHDKCVLALDTSTKEIKAVGEDAYKMIGRLPGKIKCIQPLENGVIADFEAASMLLNEYFKKSHLNSSFLRPEIYLSYPINSTEVIKTAYRDLGESLESKKVVLVEDIYAASLGVGFDMDKSQASFIMNIGSGITSMAIVSMNSILKAKSISVAGSKFNSSIREFIKQNHHLLIGDIAIENIKVNLVNLDRADKSVTEKISGRDLISGLPTVITVTQVEMSKAIKEDVEFLVKEIKNFLEEIDPSALEDILDSGLVISGESAKLTGLISYLKKELKIPVLMAESPETAIIDGLVRKMDGSIVKDN